MTIEIGMMWNVRILGGTAWDKLELGDVHRFIDTHDVWIPSTWKTIYAIIKSFDHGTYHLAIWYIAIENDHS